MAKRYLLLLSALCCWFLAIGQLTIGGQLLFGNNEEGVPGFPVGLWEDDNLLAEATTDEGGFFEFDLNTPAGLGFLEVRTFDLCTGMEISVPVVVTPAQPNYFVVLVVCPGIDPPPPPEGCEAYFFWEQVPGDEPFTLMFADLSYAEFPITTWAWAFGDGEGSAAQNPVHTYDGPGEYLVTLTISSGDCSSVYEQIVVIVDLNECDCPADVYEPVCVATPSGLELTFINACYAECAGYGPDIYYPCDGGGCGCPDIYAPVCVAAPDGQILSFDNACEAECAGYGPDLFVECEDECGCDQVWEPVCVNLFGLTIQFPNLCSALCEGFTEDQIVDCNDDCPCPDVWDPVCVQTEDGITLTFGNACEAECAGYGPDQIIPCDDDCLCPDVWDPVCVFTSAGEIVFGNACEAECAGYGPDQYVSCFGECPCPEYYDPVCVIGPDGQLLEFDNACFAECEGYGEDQFVDCNGTSCDCPEDVYDPVCVLVPGCGPLTFENACYAECEGYGPELYVNCDEDCPCPDIWDPVCVQTPFGLYTFGNSCEAECFGYTEEDFVSCTDECICPDIYDPVCVATGSGIITFDNACYAECEGFGPDSFVDCEDDCICPQVYDPVCVITASGEIVEFTNACYAACEGFGEDSFVDCEGDCECDDIYDPVCVMIGNAIAQFDNACEAECAGFGPDSFIDCDGGCWCPPIFDPVCIATPSGGFLQFDNACLAECEGFGPDDFVECVDDCMCPDVYDPVCVNGFAGQITFANACEAECAGFTPEYFVDCEDDCLCPDIWDPVCIAGFDGQVIYANACEAICAGFSPDDLIDCEGENQCDCLDVYDPVCVSTPFGIITYANSCEAQCAGYCADDFFDCGDCDCPDIYDPVCVIDPFFGIFIEFSNACEAECAGYGPDQFIPCDNTEDCFADFGFDLISENGLLVQFQDYSVTDSPIVSWEWNFGDSGSSTEQNPQHEYADAGVYDVSLTISTDDCTATIVHHICVGEGGGVTGPNCQAMFFFEQPDPDDLQYFQFWDVSFGGVATEWLWDFGDGTSSTEANPPHLFEQAGTYTVSLTITTEDGCTSTVAIVITTDYNIWYGDQMCRAWFLPIIDQTTNAVFFINLSSPDAIEFLWDFGDGTTSTNPLAFHEYEAAGTYTVSLTITTESGCVNTFIVTINLGDDDDFTGNPAFSFTVGTEEEQLLDQTIRVAPNPTNGQTIVNWESDHTDRYQWQLFDLSGRLVQQGQGAQGNQRERVDLDLSSEPSGVYLFRLQTTDGMKTLKVTKM